MSDAVTFDPQPKKPLIGLAKFLKQQVDQSYKMKTSEDKIRKIRGAKKVGERQVKIEHGREPLTDVDEIEKVNELTDEELRKVWQSNIPVNQVIFKSLNDIKPLSGVELIPMTARDEETLRDDIKEKGILVPLLVRHDGAIIDGRHRYIMAKKVGLVKVPCIVAKEGMSDHEIEDIFCTLNVARRQMDKETRERIVSRILQVHQWKKKRPGRPKKDGIIGPNGPVSHRDMAEKLHVSKAEATRLIQKAEEEQGLRPPKPKFTFDEVDGKKFHITWGKSVEKDKTFIGEVVEYIKEFINNLDKEKGTTLDFQAVWTIGEREE